MSDDDLARKFHEPIDPILGAARANELIASCMRTAPAGGARPIAALASSSKRSVALS